MVASRQSMRLNGGLTTDMLGACSAWRPFALLGTAVSSRFGAVAGLIPCPCGDHGGNMPRSGRAGRVLWLRDTETMSWRLKIVGCAILIAGAFTLGLSHALASGPELRQTTVRFTIVKRTAQRVVAGRGLERIVLKKGQRFLVRRGLGRYVVISITKRYVYLRRAPVAAATVNLKDFGAKGDGVADDTAAVRKALAAAVDRTLHVPVGVYVIKARLAVPANVAVKGSGDASWLKGPLAVGSKDHFQAITIGRDGYSCYVGSASDVTFTNVRFVGGGGNYKETWPYMDSHVLTIGVGGSASKILFERCRIERNAGSENSSKSLHLDNVFVSSCTEVNFNSCWFAGSPRFTVEIWDDSFNGSRSINFRDSVFEATECAAVDYSTFNGGYSTISGCTFKGNGAGSNPKWPDDITIEKGASHIAVTDCTFWRGRDCAVAGASSYNIVRNNLIDATLDSGIVHNWVPYISLSGDNNEVTGNTVISTGPQLEAVVVNGYYNRVTGNTVTGGTIVVTGVGNTVSPNAVN